MNSPGTSTPPTNDTTAYEIRVAGHLDDHWSAMLGDLALTRCPDGTTTLIGPVADQAQLHGVLTRVRDLGATLLGVRILAGTPTPSSPRIDQAEPSAVAQPTPSAADSQHQQHC